MFRKAAKRVLHHLRQTVGNRRSAHDAQRLRESLAQIGAPGLAPTDVNQVLHHLRGQALAKLPKDVEHFVSVGCSGTWYFEWIEQMCAPRRHSGIEFYSPRPADLPERFEWIANTAGNMEALADGTADLLFAGQNIEHLWPDDIANFLLESHRVLRDGGLLVVDSPNRRVTALLQWSQPEHTIELELPEITELLALGGFDVVRQEGLWLCETPDGTVLPFEELSGQGPWPLARRVAEATARPESSFIWWVEARKANRAPQPEKLRERIGQIFALAWPERLNRRKTIIGDLVMRDGEEWFYSCGRGGLLVYGPHTALPAGRHSLTMTLAGAGAVVQVTAANGTRVLVRQEVRAEQAPPGSEFTVQLDFELAEMTFAIEFMVNATAGRGLLAKKSVVLASHPH